jgi:hypothetical protein
MHDSFGATRVSDPIAGIFWRSEVLLNAIDRRNRKNPSWFGPLKFKKGKEEFSAAGDLAKLLRDGHRLISHKFKELKLSALENPLERTLERM